MEDNDSGREGGGSIAVKGLRALRGLASYLCLGLCCCFVSLWVQSYHSYIIFVGDQSQYFIGSQSAVGLLHTTWVTYGEEPGMDWGARKVGLEGGEAWVDEFKQDCQGYFGFGYSNTPNLGFLLVPYWFLVGTTGLLTVLIRPKPRRKVSLREFLLLSCLASAAFAAVASIPNYEPIPEPIVDQK
jgi:hypothetical protein